MKAIIIGATSGIGREMAAILVRKGWTIGIAGRRAAELESIRDGFGADRVKIAALDITQPDAVTILDGLIASVGAPDLFFHVSGVGNQNRELDEETEIRAVKTNCEGMVRMVDHFINFVRSHPESYGKRHKAHVAVVTSIAGTAGLGSAPAYSATKKMQQTYLSALAQLSRMEDIPVQFTDIRPGFVKTPILNPDKKYPMMMTLEQAGRHIWRALEKRQRVCTFDWRFRLLVFFWKLIPRPLWERMRWVRN